MSSKVTKKAAAKKVAKKVTKKVAKKAEVATSGKPTAPQEPLSGLQRLATEDLAKAAKTPKEANQQMAALLSRLVGDTSRHESQIRYLSQQNGQQVELINQSLEYIQTCLNVLFNHLHLDLPRLAPKIVGAQVTLHNPDDVEVKEGESVVLIARLTEPHPVRGLWDVAIDNDSASLESFHPIVREKIIAAFDDFSQHKGYVPGKLYRAMITIETLGEVDANSVKVG